MKRVVIGMSGGVDSSVAAYLLKEKGYEVIGLFMKNWHDDSVVISRECPWLEDSNDALIVAQKLDIPFQTIDLSKAYKERIVDYMFNEYARGRTPNPDVLCNREIKFDIFLKTALKLGADYVATGHYCRKAETQNADGSMTYHLLAGKDRNKDQSYFLCQLNQEQLSRALFPIGELQKSEVRQIAREQDLITADKKDSQGLCFVGKVRLPEFLQQKLQPKPGKIIELATDAPVYEKSWVMEGVVDTEPTNLQEMSAAYAYTPAMGKEVGTHPGAHYFTIGQRKGLNVGGTPKPLFVIATDTEENIVYTGQGVDHPGLYRAALFIDQSEVHWLREDLKLAAGESASFQVRIRYRQPLEQATLFQEKEGLYIVFDRPQKSIAKGQFAAWYQEEELFGSGVIA
ncbi:tRNA 2-thiouridine(34) synthase MnmA [Catalinimonas niigatensis]|uniref:tRNA 2-thiouridine(34) synthase MnmA n=1 Tax=Catalinimonas niigatensis TaxID=1397264 RepID=UPI0026664681|nr:tRNA 2-thiouridine(34) synthase MnmA [Catalinimonas niigatensis]WPP52735.1 tRNA 2-thiouridine(34) synthase MnmA [Catalinimonas niigatensis]